MKRVQFARRGRLASALFLWVATLSASGPGPNGINIGFNFNWNPGPAGTTATFIASVSSSGGTLNTCIGVCNFAFAYSIGGVAQTPVLPDGNYNTWTLAPGSAARGCDVPANTSPLTLFNCFNTNSFGQDFVPGTTGALTAFSMPMTCLNPAGTPLTGLFALLYQVTPSGSGGTIPATPLATAPVDLSSCPTLTSWTGHTFSAADFANIPINFSGVNLTAGNTYGVYFGGLTPGGSLPGAPNVTSVLPNSGSLAGGNTVTLTGTGFTGATSVTFGGIAATSFTVVNDTTITAVVPAAMTTGSVSVIVVTPNGSNNANTLYSYVPTVTSVTPNSGPPAGGNTVTIAGTGFTGATGVTFGGVAAASFTVVNGTTITAVVPSGNAGAVSVIVTTPGGSNTANTLYSYATPTPTLGQWGMMALACLLVVFAWIKLRRQDRIAVS